MSETKVSLLIPTMNRPDSLKRTVASYLTGSRLPDEIVVVDQSNQENSALIKELLTHFEGKVRIKYFSQAEPSLTMARNKAASEATCEILIMSDDDVDANYDTIQNTVRLFEDSSISMIAGIDENAIEKQTKIGYLFGTKSWAKRKIGHVSRSMLGRYPNTINGQIPTEWAMGYFFAIRKSCLDKWNLSWDENLKEYAYAEDLDFSYRYFLQSKKNHMRCVLDDSVRVKHLVSREYRIPSRKETYMYVCNRMYLLNKLWNKKLNWIVMYWCNFWMYVLRVIKREQPRDFFDAMIYCTQNKEEVRNGKYHI